MEAEKRAAVQAQLGQQMAEVDALHKREAAEVTVEAKRLEADFHAWQAQEAVKEAQKKRAMLKLKVLPSSHQKMPAAFCAAEYCAL